MFYITVTLMTIDKQSNGRRIEIESKLNHSCNHHMKGLIICTVCYIWIWGIRVFLQLQ